MSKFARNRKRMIRILKKQGLSTDPHSVKEWLRKADTLYWQDETERRIISLYKRLKPFVRPMGGFAMYGARDYTKPGIWEPHSYFDSGFGARLID